MNIIKGSKNDNYRIDLEKFENVFFIWVMNRNTRENIELVKTFSHKEAVQRFEECKTKYL